MTRWSRFLLSVMLALGVIFGEGTASAAGPELGPLPGPPSAQEALQAPRDSAVSTGPIPALPASYVTKDLGWLQLSYPPSAAERPVPETALPVAVEHSP